MRSHPNLLDRIRWAIADLLLALMRLIAPPKHIAARLAGRAENEEKETYEC